MNFCWSTLRVNNLDESISFYTDIIELEVINRFKAGPLEIAFLGRGETKVELICTDESCKSKKTIKGRTLNDNNQIDT